MVALEQQVEILSLLIHQLFLVAVAVVAQEMEEVLVLLELTQVLAAVMVV